MRSRPVAYDEGPSLIHNVIGMKLRIVEPDDRTRDLKVDARVVRLGRDPACEVAFDPAKFAMISGLHAELRRDHTTVRLVHRSRSNRTLLNDTPIEREAVVRAGDRIRLGFTGPTVVIVELPADSEGERSAPVVAAARSLALDSDAGATRMVANAKELLSGSKMVAGFEVGDGGVFGRDSALARYRLDHPHVSRAHARLIVRASGVFLVDLGSANGTFVNGERVVSAVALRAGDVVDIGPYSLRFDGRTLTSQTRANNIQLAVTDVGRVVTSHAHQQLITLLHGVTFVLNPGEFLAILGPSGSGKSTLLGVLSGRSPASSGHVHVNGRDLHRGFAALKEDLAVVPQNTMLHESLSVQQSLGFTAALRLPPDCSRAERGECVKKILGTVGLLPRRDLRIRQLSGGQQKRAGLASELISEPSLLFLDEVTSGLDEHADAEMMHMFRTLADQGKTLVCVTHNLSHVTSYCHLVAVLTVGGRLAFFGSPEDALKYFDVPSLADIYARLETRTPDEWAHAFRQTAFHATYVAARQTSVVSQEAASAVPQAVERMGSFLRQWIVLVARTVAIWRNDPQALAALFGQAALVAFLLCLVFGGLDADEAGNSPERLTKIQNLLFLVGVSSFWLGCNNSVKEIVKERRIFERERDFNLIPESYLAAKVLVMAIVGVSQALFLGATVFGWCHMPGSLGWHLFVLSCLSLAGTTLGLAISSVAKTEEVAVAAVPLVVLPQIILAGVVATLPDFAELLARVLSTVYWGQRGLVQVLEGGDRIASSFEPSYGTCAIVIHGHAVVFLAAAWYGIRWIRRQER